MKEKVTMKNDRAKSLLYSIKGDRVIAYQVGFTKITGKLTSGILLSQLVYWSGKVGGREFYKVDSEICDETGLSLDELKSAKKNLILKNFIKVSYKSLPRKSYYKLNEDLIINLLTSEWETHLPVSGNSTDWRVEIPLTTSEITTEITQDIYLEEKNLFDDLPVGKELEKVKKKGRPKVDLHELTEEEENWFNNLDDKTIKDITSFYEIDEYQLRNFARQMISKLKAKGYMYKDFKQALSNWIGREFKPRKKVITLQENPEEFVRLYQERLKNQLREELPNVEIC
jgi:hypothetical protein